MNMRGKRNGACVSLVQPMVHLAQGQPPRTAMHEVPDTRCAACPAAIRVLFGRLRDRDIMPWFPPISQALSNPPQALLTVLILPRPYLTPLSLVAQIRFANCSPVRTACRSLNQSKRADTSEVAAPISMAASGRSCNSATRRVLLARSLQIFVRLTDRPQHRAHSRGVSIDDIQLAPYAALQRSCSRRRL